MSGVELLVNVEPIPDRYPAHRRYNQEQGRHSPIQVKGLFKMEPDSGLIRSNKRQRDQKNVCEAKDCLDFSVVAAKHPELRIPVLTQLNPEGLRSNL